MDDIKRKLALIDKQLAGGPNFLQRPISTSPLAIVAVGFIAGIVIQNILFESRVTSHESRIVWLWLTLLGLCATAAILIFTVYKEGRIAFYAPMLLSACVLMCFLSFGAVRLFAFQHTGPNDIRNLVTGERRLATIRGVIISEPYIQQNREWKFARFKPTDPTSSFYLKMQEVESANGWAKVTGTVRVQVDEPVLDLKAGDYIQAYCWLDRFEGPTNPGQFNVAKYLARKNVFVAASVRSREAVELLKSGSGRTGTFIKIKRHLKEIASQALRGELDVESENYVLLQALVLGYRTEIDSNTYRAFQKTGLLHFICLSGMNFVILFWIIWQLCKTAGLMKRACAVICLAAAGIFLLVIPPQSPAFRAAIMSSVFCVSFFFRRKYNPFNALSLAAVILLLIRPTYLFEVGWQLSFAVVLGLLLFCARFHSFLYEKITGLSWGKKAPKTGLLFRVIPIAGPYLLRLFSTCITAWLGGAGISLYHFHRIQYLTSIWTMIVSPLIGVISVIGYLKTVLALFLPSAAAMLDIIIGPLVSLLIWLVKFMASLNISEVLIGKVSPAVVILYYAFLLFAFFVHFRRPFVKKLICIAATFVIIVFLGAAKWQRTHRNNLVITCLDVGHGQAIFAQLPGKANLLFDAGSLLKSDVGRRVIAPFLDYAGINKIDAIIISHNDIDHINGIPEVIEQCEVGGVYANDDFFDKADRWGSAKFLNDCLTEKDIKIKRLNEYLNRSSANIKILWPIEQILQNEKLGDNDKSLVSLLEFAGTDILLCSDIEKFAQRELLRLYPDLKADVVVVPHHGSVNTLEANFLEKLDADILIYSCDRTQYERQQQTIKAKANARSFYTPKHGAVALCIGSDGMMKTTTFVP